MKFSIVFTTTILLMLLAGCNSGGADFGQWLISGPSEVPETFSATFTVDIENSPGVVLAWSVDPKSAGTIKVTSPGDILFTAALVETDSEATIQVVIHHPDSAPVLVEKEIVIENVPDEFINDDAPVAVAVSDFYSLFPGDKTKFTSESYDPNDYDSIVKWEWDFNYDESVGFVPSGTGDSAVWKFTSGGTYKIQHRVTDSFGKTDLLDIPLEIKVEDWGRVFNFTSEELALAEIVETAPGGNLYVAGTFDTAFDFDPDPYHSVTIEPSFFEAVFVSKYRTTDGVSYDYLWTFIIDGAREIDTFHILPDETFYVSGTWNGDVDLDPGHNVLNPNDGAEFNLGGFMNHHDSDGSLIDTIYEYGSTISFGEFWTSSNYHFVSIDNDPAGNIYYARIKESTTGSGDIGYSASIFRTGFEGTVFVKELLDKTSMASVRYSGDAMYTMYTLSDSNVLGPYIESYGFLKCDLNGNTVWHDQNIMGKKVFNFDKDADGNLYMSSRYPGIVDKFNSNGEFISNFDVIKGASQQEIPLNESATEIGYGKYFTVGEYFGPADFDPSPDSEDILSDFDAYYESYITSLTTDGQYIKSYGWGTSIFLKFLDCAVDEYGNVFISGYFSGEMDFDPGPEKWMIDTGTQSNKMFMMQLRAELFE